ncbi:hypothetical protein COX85_01910 [Candidatus Micrarchaeota archaeon CG_4_10_14_0_2_um_filter_55_9]|nr:MAG: hypothetical protein COT57_00655 [Candidatus Micrarchaeota archaeon CG09_land_8_20_14_0_10_55_25]PIZ91805.1 MAG: hypothetical protein COX85_01910 [Candidatus Micrarchaeota archaeon CG_4_10_14_0_2_um_filter_55_9]PJD01117.1 MAG: hypothetical protein COU38_02870 [Candidatus Micrarchaeota archaeon CG10_big_fil_rev_8_21_14_0_10_54_18]
MLVVKSAVGDYIKKKGMRLSGASHDKLSELVQGKLDMGIKRAKENKRQTVMPYDL